MCCGVPGKIGCFLAGQAAVAFKQVGDVVGKVKEEFRGFSIKAGVRVHGGFGRVADCALVGAGPTTGRWRES